MNHDSFLSSPEWLTLRDRVLERDGHRCTVARLLGGRCRGALHVNHIIARSERHDLALDEDNCGTACAAHHPQWEALVRALRRRHEPPRCRHVHPYPQGRRECEERMARQLQAA